MLSYPRLSKLCKLYKMKMQLANYMTALPTMNSSRINQKLKLDLRSSFNKYWYNIITTDISTSGKEGGNKLRTYRTFKKSIGYENYLNIDNYEKRRKISQLRLSAHNLKIETGRFDSKNIYVPPELRQCDYCNFNRQN